VHKRQIYQIAESNRIESKLFLPELECSSREQRTHCSAQPHWGTDERHRERERGELGSSLLDIQTDRQTDSRPAGRCCMLLWTVPVDLLFTTTLPGRLPSEYSTSTDRLLGDLAISNRLFIHLQDISYTNKSKRVYNTVEWNAATATIGPRGDDQYIDGQRMTECKSDEDRPILSENCKVCNVRRP